LALFLSFKVFIITLINQNMNAIELKLLIIFLLENIALFYELNQLKEDLMFLKSYSKELFLLMETFYII